VRDVHCVDFCRNGLDDSTVSVDIVSQHSTDAGEIRLKCRRFQLNFQWFLNKLHLFWIIWNPCYVTLCCVRYSEHHLHTFWRLAWDVVTLVWPRRG